MIRHRSTVRSAWALAVLVLLGTACAKGSPAPSEPPGTTTLPATTSTTVESSPSVHPSPSPSPSSSPIPPGSPVPTESNPPGDIPDNTVFVPFASSAGHFKISVPEGWSRSSPTGSSLMFTDEKLNVVTVSWAKASSAPTASSAKKTDIPRLQQSERAFQLEHLRAVRLPGGPAVEIIFLENSAPDAVTGKQYRTEVLRFELFHAGEEAVISLASPVGRDNVDPWRIISESFRWV